MNSVGKRFLEQAGDYQRQFTWLGCPIVRYPSDIVALQEIIWRCKPQVIIETGVAYGGTALFYASILELIGDGHVYGIDVDLSRVNPLVGPCKRVTLIEGSSVNPALARSMSISVCGNRVMVVLDSLHHKEHVAQELALWSPLVSLDQYMVVCDTTLADLHLDCRGYPLPTHVQALDNPKVAVTEFLHNNTQFESDTTVEERLLVTAMSGGYLRRVK